MGQQRGHGRGVVLVHGAMHDARCWTATIDELRSRAPDLPVVAVDLPGRGAHGGALMDYSLSACAAAISQQAHAAGLDEFVLVGHSAAGLVLPCVAANRGPSVVKGIVFVAAYVPVDGGCTLDLMGPVVRRLVRWTTRGGRPVPPVHPLIARITLCNGMTQAQRRTTVTGLCDEYPLLPMLTADRAAMPYEIPRGWILTTRDRAISPAKQRQGIANLGGVAGIIEIDSCHDVMISEPAKLAEALLSFHGNVFG